MRFDAFVGPSYTPQSRGADVQRTVNFYAEFVASGVGKNKLVLYGRPGLALFVTFPDAPMRGLFWQDGRCFGVGGGTFSEITLTGPTTGQLVNSFPVVNDGNLVTMWSNGVAGHQLFLVSAGTGYIFDLNTNVLTKIAAANFPTAALQGLFSDGFFIVLKGGASQLWSSALEDGTTWAGTDTAQRSTSSDNIQAIAINHRELWLFGSLTTEVWYDSGVAVGFPYAPIPGAFIEQGAFTWSIGSIDNTLLWVGQDRNGQGMAFRGDGYSPKRISTSAVEYAWSQYATIADVENFTYQEQGHAFWVLNFPTANKTWIYDTSTDMWCEADWYNAAMGKYERILPRCHAPAFGMHLVGDRQSGNVYLQSLSYYDDNGVRIHRRRRAPHITNEKMWTYYQQFQIDADVGIGIASNLQQTPYAILRWSNDGGFTWSNDYQVSFGLIGAFRTRLQWNRLGRARDRVFEFECAEAMPVRLINAYMDIEQGTS